MSAPPLSRRDLLKKLGKAGLTLAAARVFAPPLSANPADKDDDKTIKVGILHSLTGILAYNEISLKDAELLAIEEINAKGGVLGKKIDAIIEDPESKFTDIFPEKAKKLLVKEQVAVIFGCWTSVSRKFILPILEENDGLLFYPVPYEGNERSKHVVYTGAVPNQQSLPAVDYLWKEKSKKKFYLLGSDYIFPRTTNKAVTDYLKKEHNAEPVATKYVPLGHKDFADIVADIKKQQPDVVLNTLVGDSNLTFFAALNAAEIKPADIPVCSLNISEDDLRGLEAEAFVGHLAAWSYFQSVDTPRNKEFVKSYQKKYGKDRPTSAPIAAAYFQVYLWKVAVEKAKSFEPDKVREAIKGLKLETPEGEIQVDDENNHLWKPFRIGEILKDGQFKIVYESKKNIKPEP
jgi:urea transport system substrate-binding protein